MSREPGRGDADAFAGSPVRRRGAARTRRTLAVECRGIGGLRMSAKTVDVSRGGMLLELTDSAIVSSASNPGRRSTDGARRLSARGDDVFALFPDGIDVAFGEGAVIAHARIARFVPDPTRPDSILLGCRFAPALTPTDCALLGVASDADERPGATTARAESDGRPVAPAQPVRADALLDLIDAPDRVWGDHRLPTDARPVSGAPLPPIKVGSRVTARETRVAEPATPRTTVTAPATGPRILVPTPTTREKPALRLASPAGASAPVAGGAAVLADRVTAYLFPSTNGALGPRLQGRLESIEGRTLRVELPVPPGESDPVGHAAALGELARTVLMRDGRILGETTCRVERIEARPRGAVRVELWTCDPIDPAIVARPSAASPGAPRLL